MQYIGVQHDVTARVEAERALIQERDRNKACLTRIEELAYTDPLTGLPNRRRLEEQVETAIWDARSGSDTLALLFVDLDGFKAVNDGLGHAAGDELLQIVARTLRGRLRRGDLLARLGGDEFLVALTGLDPESAAVEARRVADELAAAVRLPWSSPAGGRGRGERRGRRSTPGTARSSPGCCTAPTSTCTRGRRRRAGRCRPGADRLSGARPRRPRPAARRGTAAGRRR